MRVFVAPQDSEFLPRRTRVKYPPNNTNRSFTVEQDFYRFMTRSRGLLTERYEQADWIYIPVFWQRHCFNNDYYMGEQGLERLQAYLSELPRSAGKRCFAISGMDNGPLGSPRRRPMIEDAVFFNGCTGDEELELRNVFTIPLLTSRWKVHPRRERKYLASFVGRRDTHPSRARMFSYLANRRDVCLIDGYVADYARVIADSLVSLCPRGNGLSSFRFFESMQIGVVPVLIAERDVRPFRDEIEWDAISFHVRTVEELDQIMGLDREILVTMGQRAREVYTRHLDYQKWCPHVMSTLERLQAAAE